MALNQAPCQVYLCTYAGETSDKRAQRQARTVFVRVQALSHKYSAPLTTPTSANTVASIVLIAPRRANARAVMPRSTSRAHSAPRVGTKRGETTRTNRISHKPRSRKDVPQPAKYRSILNPGRVGSITGTLIPTAIIGASAHSRRKAGRSRLNAACFCTDLLLFHSKSG